ncbi:hypothetical protein ACP275_13G042100 [Erythranthe tilingii]
MLQDNHLHQLVLLHNPLHQLVLLYSLLEDKVAKDIDKKNKKSGKKSGPHAGIGNWNREGMFKPPVQSGANNGSQVHVNNFSDRGNIEMQVHNTIFGNVFFSSQSRSNRFAVITDNGET